MDTITPYSNIQHSLLNQTSHQSCKFVFCFSRLQFHTRVILIFLKNLTPSVCEEPRTNMSDQQKQQSFKALHPFNDRKSEAGRINAKYGPERVPCIVEKLEKSGIANIDKKVTRQQRQQAMRITIVLCKL